MRTPHCRAHSARSTKPFQIGKAPRAQFDEAYLEAHPTQDLAASWPGTTFSFAEKGKPHLSSLLCCSKDLGTKPKSPPTPPLFHKGKANAGAPMLSNKPARRRLAGLRLQSKLANAHQQTPRVFRPGIGAPSSLFFGLERLAALHECGGRWGCIVPGKLRGVLKLRLGGLEGQVFSRAR